jgi:PQQ-like domain
VAEQIAQFSIEQNGTAITVLVNAPIAGPNSRLRRASTALFGAFLALPLLLLAARSETIALWPWMLYVGLGLGAATLDLLDIARRLGELTAPYRLLRQSLTIDTPPQALALRTAPRRPRLVIDGVPVASIEEPRVHLTRTSHTDEARWILSVVLRAEIIRLGEMRSRDEAIALTERLCEALECAPPQEAGAVERIDGPTWFTRLLGVLDHGALFWTAHWAIHSDLTDRVGFAMALAAALALAVILIARQLAARLWHAASAKTAEQVHGVARGKRPRQPRDLAILAAPIVLALGALVARAALQPPELPAERPYRWSQRDLTICAADVNHDGAADPIGLTLSAEGPALAAVDGRTGAWLWRAPQPSSTVTLWCLLPVVVVMQDDETGDISLTAFDAVTGEKKWEKVYAGTFYQWNRSGDCLLVETQSADVQNWSRWRALSLETGGACTSIPELAGERPSLPLPLGADAKLEDLTQWPDDYEAKARAQKAYDDKLEEVRHRGVKREEERGLASATNGGVIYSLRYEEGLSVTAERGDVASWTTHLTGNLAEGFPPIAATDRVVVVAATADWRTGKRQRLIGLDPASGEVLYVHRLDPEYHGDVLLRPGGDVVLLRRGWLGAVDARTGELLWTSQR